MVFFHRRWLGPGGHFFDHGYLAVDFFFGLSGFVIAHAYRDRILGGMQFGEFVRVRAIRLYPLMLLGTVLGACRWGLYDWLDGVTLDWTFAAGLGAALLTLPTPVSATFDPQPMFPMNEPHWSLFFEILANLAFFCFVRRLTTPVVATIVVVSLVVLALTAMPLGGFYHRNFWSGFPRTSFSFFLGVLLFMVHRRIAIPRLGIGLATLSIVLILAFSPVRKWGGATYDLLCIAVLFPAIILLGARAELSGTSAKVAAFLGALSYPVYVLHYPVLLLMDTLVEANFAILLLTTIVILLLGWSALKLYDEPVRAWLSGRTRSAPSLSRRRAVP